MNKFNMKQLLLHTWRIKHKLDTPVVMEDIWDLQLFACLFLVAFFKAGKKGSVCSVDTVYPVIVYNISVSLVHWFVPFIGGQKEKKYIV